MSRRVLIYCMYTKHKVIHYIRDLVNVLLVFASTVSPPSIENTSIDVGRGECVGLVQ